jgi:hypothetical protein
MTLKRPHKKPEDKRDLLHMTLCDSFLENFPLNNADVDPQTISYYSNSRNLFIAGHGRFTNVINYAIIPANLLPEDVSPDRSGYHLYMNRE